METKRSLWNPREAKPRDRRERTDFQGLAAFQSSDSKEEFVKRVLNAANPLIVHTAKKNLQEKS